MRKVNKGKRWQELKRFTGVMECLGYISSVSFVSLQSRSTDMAVPVTRGLRLPPDQVITPANRNEYSTGDIRWH